MSSRPITDEEAVAAADKVMEERANRAKELLSRRYTGLKRQQVGSDGLIEFFTWRLRIFSILTNCSASILSSRCRRPARVGKRSSNDK